MIPNLRYNNRLFSKQSAEFFGAVLHGIVVVSNAIEYGWSRACEVHQRLGLIDVGFYRACGGLATLYVDDVLLAIEYARGAAVARSLLYGFLALKFKHFGYWRSVSKSSGGFKDSVRVLGLICDARVQCFRVPEDKLQRFLGRLDALAAMVAGGHMVDIEAARVAGVAMSFSGAIPTVRGELNMIFGALSQRQMRGVVAGDPAWWTMNERGSGRRKLSPAVVGPLGEELVRLRAAVTARTEYPFVPERHTAEILLHNDATLIGSGCVVMSIDRVGRRTVIAEFGSTLPSHVDDDPALAAENENTGTTELFGLMLTISAVERTPSLRGLFENSRVSCGLDNNEGEWGCSCDPVVFRVSASFAGGGANKLLCGGLWQMCGFCRQEGFVVCRVSLKSR